MEDKQKLFTVIDNKIKLLTSKKFGSIFSNLTYGVAIGSAMHHEDIIRCPNIMLQDASIDSIAGLFQIYTLFKKKNKKLNIYVNGGDLSKYEKLFDAYIEFNRDFLGIKDCLISIIDNQDIEITTKKKVQCLYNEKNNKMIYIFKDFRYGINNDILIQKVKGEMTEDQYKEKLKQDKTKCLSWDFQGTIAYVGKCSYDFYEKCDDAIMSKMLILQLADNDADGITLKWLVENYHKIYNAMICIIPDSSVSSFERTALELISVLPDEKKNSYYVADKNSINKLADISTIKIYENKGLMQLFSTTHFDPIKIGNITFPSVEHYYQYNKTTSIEERNKILELNNPQEVQEYGDKLVAVDTWNERKDNILMRAYAERIKKNRELIKILKLTNKLKIEYKSESVDTTKNELIANVLTKLRNLVNQTET